MRAVAVCVIRGLALVFLVLLGSGTARAASTSPFNLQVFADGALIGTADSTRLGCVDNPDGVSAVCNAADLQYGPDYAPVNISITNMAVDSDPVVTGTTGITNSSPSATQHITLVFSLPVSPISAPTLTGGRVSGTLTDSLGDGATVSAPTGSAFYTALIDGVPWQQLYTDPTSISTTTSMAIAQKVFGAPIPSLIGPAVTSSIGIVLDFNLSPLDSVSFTSNFVVVPEPSTAALLGLGLAMSVRRRRTA